MQIKCILFTLTFALLTSAAHADLRVAATTPSLAQVAQAVGGNHAKVVSLSLPTQDPHWVDPRPHLALELAKADLLVLVGLGLEQGWLPRLLTASRNGKIQKGARAHLDVSELVQLLEVRTGKADRSAGDIHPGGNPHYMVDPRRVLQVAEGMAKRMSVLDPANADDYANNAKLFSSKLVRWQKHWEAQLKPLRGQKVIGYHHSLSYLADWLGFRVVIHLEPKPGVPPSPGHVAHVIEVGKHNHVRLLVQESYHPKNTSELVSEKLGAKLALLPGGPDYLAGESYFGFLNTCVVRLKASLGS